MMLKSFNEMTPEQQLAYRTGYEAAVDVLPPRFPSDEDVEVALNAIRELRAPGTLGMDTLEMRAALQAVADARRTEEEG